ncbi:MAG TPA: FAD binding domain-containing protein [Thermotogota bacterium]|nr:FAD binding domain-containing protein [Thermotogota bacterium]HRW91399.1 FAD binding domain-containing protein [Thermotogota bacterium]
MMNALENYLYPESIEQAWEWSQEHPHALFLTGGLSISQRKDNSTLTIIDVKKILPSAIEKKQGSWKVGGAVTLNQLLEELPDSPLKTALDKVGSNQIRNMATIAGTIGQAYSWSDVLTALVAYQATVHYFDGKRQKMTLEPFLIQKPLGLITEVEIPFPYSHGEFFKQAQTGYDIAHFNFCAVFHLQQSRISDVGIACGARPGVAQRARHTEQMLQNLPANEVLSHMDGLIKTLKDEINVKSNADCSEEYRRELAGVYLQQVLEKIPQP